MECKIIVFAGVCVALLACMWRGGPCSTLWRRCKERLATRLPESRNSPGEKLAGSREPKESGGR